MFTYSYWFSLYYIIVIIVIYRCFVLSSFFVCVFSRCVISFGFLAYPQIAKAWHRTVSKWSHLRWGMDFVHWHGDAWPVVFGDWSSYGNGMDIYGYMYECVMMCYCMDMYDLLSRCWKWRWTRQLEYPFCVYFFGHFKFLTKGVKWLKWQATNIQFGSHIQFGSRHVLSLKRLTKLNKDMEEVVRTTVSQLKHVSRKAFWSDWSIES